MTQSVLLCQPRAAQHSTPGAATVRLLHPGRPPHGNLHQPFRARPVPVPCPSRPVPLRPWVCGTKTRELKESWPLFCVRETGVPAQYKKRNARLTNYLFRDLERVGKRDSSLVASTVFSFFFFLSSPLRASLSTL